MKDIVPVSVVIPCHNASATVARAFESVANQTVQPLEVIAVDDCSSDGTVDVLDTLVHRGFPFAVRLVRLPENRGPSDARNVGCDLASPLARFVAFLDADDTWLPNKLLRQTAWMDMRREIAWTAHRCGIHGQPGTRISATVEQAAMPMTRSALLARNPVATSTVVFRVSTPARFRSGWRWCEDLMLWIDWLDGGYAGVLLDEQLALLGRMPKTPGGSTGNLLRMYQGEQKVVQTLVDEGRLSPLWAVAWRLYAWARYIRRGMTV